MQYGIRIIRSKPLKPLKTIFGITKQVIVHSIAEKQRYNGFLRNFNGFYRFQQGEEKMDCCKRILVLKVMDAIILSQIV